LSSLPLVSCFDTSAKGQLYQKFSKLPYCCRIRQNKALPPASGAAGGHSGDKGAMLAPSPAATPVLGRSEIFAFVEDVFQKAIRKRCFCLAPTAVRV